MTFFTRINLDQRQVRQLTGDTLTLSGSTNFTGSLLSKSVEIDATNTGATVGDIMVYDGTKIVLSANTGGIISNGANGISKSGEYLVLGGTLTGNTIISASTFGLAFGNGAISSTGASAFATGCRTCAWGDNSHAEGYRTCAIGFNSHAEGEYTRACGRGSHAEGDGTWAIGVYSHSEGCGTFACGESSHAQGKYTTAFANHSHTEGYRTKAYGDSSHAGGVGTNTGTRHIFACGCSSFNHSRNTVAQISGYGANANYSAILGGTDHNIESGNTGATIIGGDTIRLTGTTYTGATAVARLALMDSPEINTGATQLLVRNESTGLVDYYDINTLTTNGERIEKQFSQASHGFSVGQVVADSGGTFVLALADGTQNAEIFGIVTESGNTSDFKVTFAGFVDTLAPAGLAANTTYYVSPDTAGALTPVEPLTGTSISKPILHTLASTEGLVFQYRGLFSGGTGSNITGATAGLNVGLGESVFSQLSGTTLIFRTIAGSGSATVSTSGDTLYIGVSGGTDFQNIGSGSTVYSGTSGTTNLFRTILAGTGITINETENEIVIINTGNTNSLGDARDTWNDGLFTFTNTTPVGWAIDDINEFLLLLSPNPPDDLDYIGASGTFYDGKVSFGSGNSIINYANVSSAAGNIALNINEVYESTGGTRLGITKTTVAGILNDDITGGTSNIPYSNNAFPKGDEGELVLELNGVSINILDLEGTTGTTANTSGGTTLNVSEIKYLKLDNGNEVTQLKYRIGTFIITTSAMEYGFNYIRITHDGISPATTTNYLEWVYDPANQQIVLSGESLSNLNLSGSTFISGIEYNTGGTVLYSVTGSSAYTNVFSSSATAISFPTTNNLSPTAYTINVSGQSVIAGTTQALPDLDAGASNPELTDIHIQAELLINSNVLLGISGTSGNISSNIAIDHPFPDEAVTGTTLSDSGFLIYNIAQSGNNVTEDFTGEVLRIQKEDYSTGATYAALSGGTFTWDSTESLTTGDDFHNNGLLVFNGELVYPNATYLDTTYGITSGNFGGLTNSPAGNPNYNIASGVREYYRLFKSENSATQSTITIEIDNTGSDTDFITSGATSGTPSSNDIKVEFLIVRSGDTIHGWANPFAGTGNPEGISNTDITHSGGTTTVTASLSATPRIALDDYVIVKVRAAVGWTNRISEIRVTNIE